MQLDYNKELFEDTLVLIEKLIGNILQSSNMEEVEVFFNEFTLFIESKTEKNTKHNLRGIYLACANYYRKLKMIDIKHIGNKPTRFEKIEHKAKKGIAKILKDKAHSYWNVL